MLSVALAFTSIALNISHARLRSYMFATRLFFDDFIDSSTSQPEAGDIDGVKRNQNIRFNKIIPLHMQKIEHIGIAVKNLEESNLRFAKLLNTIHYKTEEVPSEGVMTSFFQVGDVKIELLQATNESSPIHRFIESKGEGIHHIAFAVEDVNTELQRLKGAGFDAIHDTPKQGADNKVIAFLHPKSTQGVLTELCAEQS
tara:strand:- start:12821 stop:13417 length:597 start_codon:yes stop_codon:yes gene_type:complete